MRLETPDANPDVVRIRFGVPNTAARRLADHHGLDTRLAETSVLRLFLYADSASANILILSRRRHQNAELSVQLRPLRRAMLADINYVRAGAVTMTRERNLSRSMLVAELTEQRALTSRAEGPRTLSTRQRKLIVSCTGRAPEILSWRSPPAISESSWQTAVEQLPATLCRWGCSATGMNAVELRAVFGTADSEIVVQVLAAHLRWLGVDPILDEPWLEEKLQ